MSSPFQSRASWTPVTTNASGPNRAFRSLDAERLASAGRPAMVETRNGSPPAIPTSTVLTSPVSATSTAVWTS